MSGLTTPTAVGPISRRYPLQFAPAAVGQRVSAALNGTPWVGPALAAVVVAAAAALGKGK